MHRWFLVFAAALPSFTASKVLLEDAQVKVVLAENTPGAKSRPHKHDVNRVMVHLDPGKIRLAFEDGEVKDIEFQAGEVRWDPAGGMHTSENVGGTTYHIVEVEIKTGPGQVTWPEQDPLKVAAAHHKLEFENDQVRVLRMRVAPKEKTALHEHVLPRVTVYMTDQSARVTLPNGRGSTVRNKKSHVSKGGKANHAERNLGSRAFEMVFVELKGAK